MSLFWLTPDCTRINCRHHYEPAQKVFPDLKPIPATKELLAMGFIRCVIRDDTLFFERHPAPSEKQMAELKNIALEEGLRLKDDKGREILHDLPKWTTVYQPPPRRPYQR